MTGGGASSDKELLQAVASLLDETFRVLLSLARRAYHDVSIASMEGYRPRLLVVDDRDEFVQCLRDALGSLPYEFVHESLGGAALALSGDRPCDVLAVREELPDLRGSLVLQTVQTHHPLVHGLLYRDAQPEQSVLEYYVQGRLLEREHPFRGPEQLAERVKQAVARVAEAQRDRVILRVLRGEHGEFLRRLAETRSRLGRRLHQKGG